MKNHTIDFDRDPYSGLDKIQTLILMFMHTLDLDEKSYSRFGWKNHTLDFDGNQYSRFGLKIIP